MMVYGHETYNISQETFTALPGSDLVDRVLHNPSVCKYLSCMQNLLGKNVQSEQPECNRKWCIFSFKIFACQKIVTVVPSKKTATSQVCLVRTLVIKKNLLHHTQDTPSGKYLSNCPYVLVQYILLDYMEVPFRFHTILNYRQCNYRIFARWFVKKCVKVHIMLHIRRCI